MLLREIIIIYSENHTECVKYTLWGKFQNVLMLRNVAHTVTPFEMVKIFCADYM
jgi:hypothetical protein